ADPMPPVDPDTLWTRPSGGSWRFDLLPVAGNPGAAKTLVVWGDTGTGYGTPQVRNFTALGASQTYCDMYGATPTPAPAPRRRDWSRMSDHWHFSLSGCANKKYSNCDCLNGDWLLRRDRDVWVAVIKGSFADPRQESYWRLVFNTDDGFWYLDVVDSVKQPPG